MKMAVGGPAHGGPLSSSQLLRRLALRIFCLVPDHRVENTPKVYVWLYSSIIVPRIDYALDASK